MKKDIHPSNYREVAFKDMSNEEVFITCSTVNTKETIDIDGKTYPLVKLEITNTSHPSSPASRSSSTPQVAWTSSCSATATARRNKTKHHRRERSRQVLQTRRRALPNQTGRAPLVFTRK